jgi:hypothetical protein
LEQGAGARFQDFAEGALGDAAPFFDGEVAVGAQLGFGRWLGAEGAEADGVVGVGEGAGDAETE